MLSLVNVTNAQQAATYFAKDDYYLDREQREPSEWWGRGAAYLGLSGEVDRNVFFQLLSGELPSGKKLPYGRPLKKDEGKGANEKAKGRRVALDLTFSAPKSVSLMGLVGGDTRMADAHGRAVEAALEFLQEHTAHARMTRGGETKPERTGNFVVARFHHDTSRKQDPQMHTHCVVMNMTQRKDGQWRALSNEEIYRTKMAAGAVYRAELAFELRALGYRISKQHADGRFELDAFSSCQLQDFSKRRQEIEAVLENSHRQDAVTSARVTLMTRSAKRDADRAQLGAKWRAEAVESGIDFASIVHDVENSVDPPGARTISAETAVAYARDHLSERDVNCSRRDLVFHAASHGVGHVRYRDVARSLQLEMGTGVLMPVSASTDDDDLGRRFTTAEMLSIESKLVRLINDGRGARSPILADTSAIGGDFSTRELVSDGTSTTVDGPKSAHDADHEREPTIKLMIGQGLVEEGSHSDTAPNLEDTSATKPASGITLTPGQRRAAQLVLGTSDSIVGVYGYAGTGKTTMLREVKRHAEQCGYTLRGLAPSAAAAAVLEEQTGIESTTVARQIHVADAPTDGSKQLWVVDEVSMLGNKDALRLAQQATAAGCRVVLLGDKRQLPSIESGRVFDLLMDRGMSTATMSEIVRQRNPKIREAVMLTLGQQVEKALAKVQVAEGGCADVASHYLSLGADERAKTLLLTDSNANRLFITNNVREGLLQSGELGKDELPARILDRKNLTRAQLRESANYAVGDTIRFGRSYQKLGVEKGELLRIQSIDIDTNTVHLQSKGRQSVSWQPHRADKVEAYEVQDRSVRVGDVIRWTRNDEQMGRRNGHTARVTAVDLEAGIAQVDYRGAPQSIDLEAPSHWDWGYVSTVYGAQGATADRAIAFICTETHHVSGYESWYVTESRAVNSLQVYTDDPSKVLEVIERSMAKSSALGLDEHNRRTETERLKRGADPIPRPQVQPAISLELTREFGASGPLHI